MLKPSKLKEKVKAPLPSKEDKPIMNLVTSKNFIVANAVVAILAAPKKMPSDDMDFLNKEDFGKVPPYLGRIKQDIEAEYEYIRQLREEAAEAGLQQRSMTAEERESMITGLKAKWELINSEYQLGTHMTTLDTVGKIARKENHEKTMTELEKAIDKL